ncbi:MAG: hypothetical protein ACI4KB_07035 [Oscillospiraceae bacterium]|nr:hypothetical protein [Oscillospiraceae bacterium]
MHTGIDLKVLTDFTEKDLKYYDIVEEALRANKFTNIYEEDWVYEELACILARDFEWQVANFKGYMTKGMDLRLFMELRKSALISTWDEEFYKKHTDASIAEVKKIRTEFLAPHYMDYEDRDWQLYLVIGKAWGGGYSEHIDFDFDYLGFLKDTPRGYQREDYLVECMKKYTHYDMNGREIENPINIHDVIALYGIVDDLNEVWWSKIIG